MPEVEEISDEELEQRGKEIIEQEFDEGEELQEQMMPTVVFEDDGDSFKGKFIRMKENCGPNDSNLYVFMASRTTKGQMKKIVDGEEKKEIKDYPAGTEMGVWGSHALNGKMQQAEKDKFYKIEYEGMQTSEKGRPYHKYKVISLTPK